MQGNQWALTQVAPPPCEAREAGAGVGGVACDAVIDALATIEARTQGQAHRGCGHRKEPKPQATASRMWAGEPPTMATSPFPPPEDHDIGDRASLCSVPGSLSWTPVCLQVSLPGSLADCSRLNVLGSDSGFLWRQTPPESPVPTTPLISLILSTSTTATSRAAQLPSWFLHV